MPIWSGRSISLSALGADETPDLAVYPTARHPIRIPKYIARVVDSAGHCLPLCHSATLPTWPLTGGLFFYFTVVMSQQHNGTLIGLTRHDNYEQG